MHGGTNNIPRQSVPVLLQHYQDFVEWIREVNPAAHIIISGILPRCANLWPGGRTDPYFLDKCNKKAMQANLALRNICEKTGYLTYVGHPSFCFPDGKVDRQLISRDGLHLYPAGVMQLLRDIRKGVEAVSMLKVSKIDFDIHVLQGVRC